MSVLLLLLTAIPSAGEELYRSNSLGMALEPISEVRRDEYPYVLLRQRREGGGVAEHLFHRGEELRKTVRYHRGETVVSEVWSDGKLLRRQEKREGVPRTEIEYRPGGETVRREYQWSGGRLKEMRIFRDGALTEVRRYLLDSQGRLLRVLHLRPDGSLRSASGYQPARRSPRLQSEWHENDSRRRYYRYGSGGEIELRSTGDGEGSAEVTRFFRRDGSLLSRTELPGGEGEVIRRYDDRRRVLEKITRRSGSVQRENFSYEEGRLSRRTLRSGGERRQWTYSYDGEGDLRRRRTYVNGGMRTSTEYREGNLRVVTVYRDGEPAVRLRYEGEELKEKHSLTGGMDKGQGE